MELVFKDLYKKENLTLDEILIMLNNNYDPDKKLLLQLIKYLGTNCCKLYEYVTCCELILKLINTYEDIKTNADYLRYAFYIHNIEIVELLVINNAKPDVWSLHNIFKYFGHRENVIIQVIEQILTYEDKDKYIEHMIESSYIDMDKLYIHFIKCKESTNIIKYIISCVANKTINISDLTLYKFINCVIKYNLDLFIYMTNDIKKIVESGRCDYLVEEMVKYKMIPVNGFVFGDETPLTFLIKHNQGFGWLKDYGVDFNLKNRLGETPMNLELKRGTICSLPRRTKYLLDLGFDPNIRDKDNKNAEDILWSHSGTRYRDDYVFDALNYIDDYNANKKC